MALFEWLFLSMKLWTALSETIQSDDQCAYSASGLVATPLNSCSVYSQRATSGMAYSYTFAVHEDSEHIPSDDPAQIEWQYFNALDCEPEELGNAYLMDETLSAMHHSSAQTVGSGINCDTVEITKFGGYSPFNSDECDLDERFADDYYSTVYVVNQCISAPIHGGDSVERESTESVHSAVLRCDDEKVYFEFYRECGDCQCAMEQFVYRYYGESEECWKVECNAMSTKDHEHGQSQKLHSHFGLVSHLKMFGYTNGPNEDNEDQNAAEVVVKSFISPQTPWTLKTSRLKAEEQLLSVTVPISVPRYTNEISSWSYTLVGIALLIVMCSICRYINAYDRMQHADTLQYDTLK